MHAWNKTPIMGLHWSGLIYLLRYIKVCLCNDEGRQSCRSRLRLLNCDYLFGLLTFVYFNAVLPHIFQLILDKVTWHYSSSWLTSSQGWHKCEVTQEIFAWMHVSRLIGFLLKHEFNHVRRGKCKKIKQKHYLTVDK